MLCINQSGLYSLVLTSRKPQAKPFKKWVTEEVLPSIRQTGSYVLPQQQSVTPPKVDIQSDCLLNVQDQLTVINYVLDGFKDVGVDSKLIHSAKMSALAAQFPSMAPAISATKESLMLQTPDEGRRYNVTELGKMLAERLGLPNDIKPTQINEALRQAGFG